MKGSKKKSDGKLIIRVIKSVIEVQRRGLPHYYEVLKISNDKNKQSFLVISCIV